MKTFFRRPLAILALALSALVANPAIAGALTDYAEGALLGHVFKQTAYTSPTTLYVELYTTACSDSARGTEPSGGAYARVAVTASGTEWTGPTAGNGTVTNANPVTFPAPSGAGWGTVSHWGISDALTGGNAITCAALTTPKTINDGDAAPSFAAGALTFQIDN